MQIRIKKVVAPFVAAYERFAEDDGWAMTAAVAYYLGLSFLPMLLILIAGLGLFLRFAHSGQDAQHAILSVVKSHLSPSAEQLVQQALDQVRDNAITHGPLALVIMLFSAIPGFVELARAFDRIERVDETTRRKGILAAIRLVLFERFVGFLLLCALGLLVIAVFVTGLIMAAIEKYTEHFLPGSESHLLWHWLRIGATFSMNAVLFTLIYHWMPKEKVRIRDAFRGGLIASLVWEIGRQLLAALLIGTRYTNAYGVVGSFIGLMLWCYYAIAVLLLGAEYIQVSTPASRLPKARSDRLGDEQSRVHQLPAPTEPRENSSAVIERSAKVTLGIPLDS